MKYKIGDKIEIARMEEYSKPSIEALSKTNYIVTIKEVIDDNRGFVVEEFAMFVPYRTVIGIYSNPVENRFELLDIRSN